MPEQFKTYSSGSARILASAAIRCACFIAGCGAVVVSALATEPSQIPLTSRSGDTPPPNVMITLDDSASMNLSFMPAGKVTVNGFSIQLDNTIGVSDHLAAFPNDPRLSAAGMLGAVIPAEKTNATAYQMQWRSADVNTIWYNPTVRYRPWLKPQANTDGTGVYMDNSVPTAAKWDPVSTGLNPANFNLTVNITGLSTKWCTAAATCGTATKNFNPGLFYTLNPGTDPNKVANFVQYDVNDSAAYSPTRTTKPSGRTDCAGTSSCTQAEERQNFANWFTYYRMRESLAKGSLTEALFGYQNKMRVAGVVSIMALRPRWMARPPLTK